MSQHQRHEADVHVEVDVVVRGGDGISKEKKKMWRGDDRYSSHSLLFRLDRSQQ
jgi:hypothetical protein